MTMLEEKIAERAKARGELLLIRGTIRTTEASIAMNRAALAELQADQERTQKRLSDLTTEVGKLLHADLAGIEGKNG